MSGPKPSVAATVTVVDNHDGTLTATVAYDDASKGAITNTYSTTSTTPFAPRSASTMMCETTG